MWVRDSAMSVLAHPRQERCVLARRKGRKALKKTG